MREIYLDNSATTQVAEPAAKAVYEMLVSCYGNPSSLHRKGLEAENRITAARKSLAKLLDCDPAEITFTSGGTEANNLALLGVAEASAQGQADCDHSDGTFVGGGGRGPAGTTGLGGHPGEAGCDGPY